LEGNERMVELRMGLILAMLCFCSGCGTQYWYQEGKTFDQCYEDHRGCYEELAELSELTGLGDRELDIIDDCMRRKGYRPVLGNSLPPRTRSLRPNRSIHYRLKGLAGSLDQE